MTAEYPPSATTFIIVLWGEGECRHSDKMTYKKASKSGSSRHGCPGERKGWHGHSKIFSVSTASVLCTPPRKLAALFQGVRGSLALKMELHHTVASQVFACEPAFMPMA